MVSKKSRQEVRAEKHRRIRSRLSGTADRPRLAVFRSNDHMYAQIIDDTVGNTIVAASTLDKDVKAELTKTNNVEAAAYLGTVIAKKALEMLISGPKENEKENGLYTSIPTNTSVNYVKFQNNKVIADFSKNLNSGGGSFDMTQRRSQIENTLRSIYPNKDIEIAISVDGSEEQALQP